MKTVSDHPPTAESSRPCDEDEEEYNHFGGFFCNIKTKIWKFLFVQMYSVLHILSQSSYKVLFLYLKKVRKPLLWCVPILKSILAESVQREHGFMEFKLHVP